MDVEHVKGWIAQSTHCEGYTFTEEELRLIARMLRTTFPHASRENATLIPLTVSTKIPGNGTEGPLHKLPPQSNKEKHEIVAQIVYPFPLRWDEIPSMFGATEREGRLAVRNLLAEQVKIVAASPCRRMLQAWHAGGTTKSKLPISEAEFDLCL